MTPETTDDDRAAEMQRVDRSRVRDDTDAWAGFESLWPKRVTGSSYVAPPQDRNGYSPYSEHRRG